MIVRGVDFPDRAVKEFIAEQAMIIDNLTEMVKQRDELIKVLQTTIEQLKSRKRKVTNG
jgi:hypothetical protein